MKSIFRNKHLKTRNGDDVFIEKQINNILKGYIVKKNGNKEIAVWNKTGRYNPIRETDKDLIF